jgi:hypothetical protein
MLDKTTIKNNFEYELLEKYKDYRKYELTIKPKITSIINENEYQRINYMESQLHHVQDRLNSKLTSNYRKPQKSHLLVKSINVVERNTGVNGVIHTHSIFAIHKDVEEKFLRLFRFDGKRFFVRQNLMEQKFSELSEIECQKLDDELDVMNYISYMLKVYNDKADREGVLNDYFCFIAHPIPSNAKSKMLANK